MMSSHWSPSTAIVIAGRRTPPASGTSPTAVTVPETDEWTLADTNPSAAAINCPVTTRSPLATHGTAGAPICCDSGMTATVGGGNSTMASARLILNPGG